MDGLIVAQIKSQVNRIMNNLLRKENNYYNKLSTQIRVHLKLGNVEFKKEICQRTEEEMAGVKCKDYVAKIDETIKSILSAEFRKGVDVEFTIILKDC